MYSYHNRDINFYTITYRADTITIEGIYLDEYLLNAQKKYYNSLILE